MKITASGDSPSFIEEFSQLPGQVRKDPYRNGLLQAEVWKGFVTAPTPFPKEFWIASDADRVIGRIGASVSPTRQADGAIGFFEVDLTFAGAERVGMELLATAEEWLKSKGVATVHGPMNFNTWFPYRFRVGKPKERFSWEAENPPGYVDVWKKAGYKIIENYHSQGHEGLAEVVQATKPGWDEARGFGFEFRAFDGAQLMEREVPILYDISMESFRDAFLFEPISLEAFKSLYVPISGKMDLRFCVMASHPDHGPVGFFFAFPDAAFPDAKYAVFKTVAVKQVARGKGVSNAMMHWAAKRALERGLGKLITAMVKSGAQSESYGRKAQLLWQNDYVLLTKEI